MHDLNRADRRGADSRSAVPSGRSRSQVKETVHGSHSRAATGGYGWPFWVDHDKLYSLSQYDEQRPLMVSDDCGKTFRATDFTTAAFETSLFRAQDRTFLVADGELHARRAPGPWSVIAVPSGMANEAGKRPTWASDGQTLWVSDGVALLRSRDDGRSWETVHQADSAAAGLGADAELAGPGTLVLRSADARGVWAAWAPRDEGRGPMIVRFEGGAWKKVHAGSNLFDLGGNMLLIADAKRLEHPGARPTLQPIAAVSIDGGAHWETHDVPGSGLIDDATRQGDALIIVTTALAVTRDGGKSWHQAMLDGVTIEGGAAIAQCRGETLALVPQRRPRHTIHLWNLGAELGRTR